MGVAGRQHKALATLRPGRMLGRRRRFRDLVGSGGSWVQGVVAEEGVYLSAILDASVGQSEVSLKLGHSCLKGEFLVFRCCRLRYARGVGCFASILLLPVFR